MGEYFDAEDFHSPIKQSSNIYYAQFNSLITVGKILKLS